MIRVRTVVATAALMLPLASANADTAIEQELRRLIDLQEQRIKVLERKLEIQDETTKAAVAATPVVKASPKGFSWGSADNANVIKVRGLLHADGVDYIEDADLKGINSWSLGRVRPIIEGTVGGIYDFRFMPDFGRGRTVIQDAWVTGRFAAVARADGRQVQGARRPRAPAVRERHALRAARVPDEPRPESRHRRAVERQHRSGASSSIRSRT